VPGSVDAAPSGMDLFDALALLCGDPPVEWSSPRPTPAALELRDRIGPARHYLFVLADGLGMNLRGHFPSGGFFETYLSGQLRAIFPSTTSSVLTSLITGQWPSRHGVVGWFTYLPERHCSTVPLPFTERFSGESLAGLGIEPFDLFPRTRRTDRFDRLVRLFSHGDLVDTSFGRWSTGNARAVGFGDLEEAFTTLVDMLRSEPAPSYNYLYVSDIDHEEHRHGIDSPQVRERIVRLDEHLLRFRQSSALPLRLVVSTDHGHVEVPEDGRIVLRDEDALMSTLAAPPSGEPRTPVFHVRPGLRREFLAASGDLLEDRFDLLTTDEAERKRLLGPEPLSARARARLGDFIGMAGGRSALVYAPPGREPLDFVAYHGGPSKDEMRIPLFLA